MRQFVYHSIDDDGEKTALISRGEDGSFITLSPDYSVTDPADLPKSAFLIAKYFDIAHSLDTEEDPIEKQKKQKELEDILEELKDDKSKWEEVSDDKLPWEV